MKTEAEISHLWQLAHLKFHFGEKMAVHSMIQSVTCKAEIEFHLNLHPEFLDSQAGNALFREKSADDGTGTKSFAEQRKEPVAPQTRNPAIRIALLQASIFFGLNRC